MGSLPPPYHGTSIYLKNLIDLLKGDGEFQVEYVDGSDKRNDMSNLGRLDTKNISSAIRAIYQLLVCLLRARPDLLYVPIAQNSLAFIRDGLYIIIGKFLGSKVLIHLHGSYFRKFYESSNWLVRRYVDLVMNQVGDAIVLGERLRPIFYRWFAADEIFVLPNFVTWTQGEPGRTKNNNGEITLTYLGNLVESKGVFDFLDAMKIVLANVHAHLNVRIAGLPGRDPSTGLAEQETKGRCESRAAELSSENAKVDLLGAITNETLKAKLLRDTDIFIFPTWYKYEGQPLVLLEAMSAGCPIISTTGVGVIDETVANGHDGILVEKRDVAALASAIIKLIEDDKLRSRMSANAYESFKSRFSSASHLRMFKEIVTTVIGE